MAGRFERSGNYGFLIPDGKKMNEDIFISKKGFSGARSGDRVVVEITEFPSASRSDE